MNILLIDDDPGLRKTIRLALETMGHRVTKHWNACESWRRWPTTSASLDRMVPSHTAQAHPSPNAPSAATGVRHPCIVRAGRKCATRQPSSRANSTT